MDFDLVAELTSTSLLKRGNRTSWSGMLLLALLLPMAFGAASPCMGTAVSMSPIPHQTEWRPCIKASCCDGKAPPTDDYSVNEAMANHTLGAGCTEDMIQPGDLRLAKAPGCGKDPGTTNNSVHYTYYLPDIEPHSPVPGAVPTAPGRTGPGPEYLHNSLSTALGKQKERLIHTPGRTHNPIRFPRLAASGQGTRSFMGLTPPAAASCPCWWVAQPAGPPNIS